MLNDVSTRSIDAMSAETLIIIGAGRHGRIVAEAANASGRYRVLGFADGNPTLVGSLLDGLPILGDWPVLTADAFIVAVGDNRRREEIATKVLHAGRRLAVVLSPDAKVSSGAEVGEGTVILGGSIIQAGARIGRNTIVNIGVLADHDAVVGDHANVGPGVILACFGRVEAREKVMPGTIRGGLPPAAR